jgi:hypothetical protein
VDAIKREGLDPNTLKPNDLPEAMKTMTPKQRFAYIDQKTK